MRLNGMNDNGSPVNAYQSSLKINKANRQGIADGIRISTNRKRMYQKLFLPLLQILVKGANMKFWDF
jgi:hypothetical protein